MKKVELTMFSPRERKIIHLIGNKKITITELTQEFYEGRRTIKANNGIGGVVRDINEKCEYHRLPWFINGVGGGRAGKLVWKDKRG